MATYLLFLAIGVYCDHGEYVFVDESTTVAAPYAFSVTTASWPTWRKHWPADVTDGCHRNTMAIVKVGRHQDQFYIYRLRSNEKGHNNLAKMLHMYNEVFSLTGYELAKISKKNEQSSYTSLSNISSQLLSDGILQWSPAMWQIFHACFIHAHVEG